MDQQVLHVRATFWPQLLPELAEHIASFLDPNDIPCGLRLVNKATASQFSSPRYTTIHLSQPTPPDMFARQWGDPSVMRHLTYNRRRQLLCLTAASGSIPNLEVAVSAAGCFVDGKVLSAAATAERLEVCHWLMQREFSWYEVGVSYPRDAALSSPFVAAAGKGLGHVCEWLLGKGCPADYLQAAMAAARGGHASLAEWALQRLPPQQSIVPHDIPAVLAAVAEGCDLLTFQRLYRQYQPLLQGDVADFGFPFDHEHFLNELVAAAARSPTPDWAAKVEWLEVLGCPRTVLTTHAAAACPGNALDRLNWLLQRGYPVDGSAVIAAAREGNAALLRHLLSTGHRLLAHGGPIDESTSHDAAGDAAAGGHVACLQALKDAGCELDPCRCAAAAGCSRDGNRVVFQWLTDELCGGDGGQICWSALRFAAATGNVPMLAGLHEAGCQADRHTFELAAMGGCVEAMEWLLERGCPMREDGAHWWNASERGDFAALSAMLRLRCTWGETGRALQYAEDFAPRPVLRWMVEAGCPIDCAAELEFARERNAREDLVEALERRLAAASL